MSANLAMTERHGRLLAAFAERAARLAENLADRALAADDAAEAADLARAFHTVGRSLRQAIALEQRLERDAARAQRQARESGEVDPQAVDARKRLLADQLRALAWRESEPLDVDLAGEDDCAEELLCEHLEQELENAAAADPKSFLATPVETQVTHFLSRFHSAAPSKLKPLARPQRAERAAPA
ncbi:hypothetical protein [Phenylobacterium deserti]|nr:hypothetical protein [Phenylobacterium deserti]